jgi:hypothetical protein
MTEKARSGGLSRLGIIDRTPMLKGRLIELRPARESDLDSIYEAHMNIADRGAYFPRGVQSEPAFRRAFAENGFWEREAGTLLLIASDGELAGTTCSSIRSCGPTRGPGSLRTP